ncbi:hypothetical protein JI666_04200 [Bacillus sp. NTK071]|uniref:hypothetical protein n=1 Tax=Bacillus sp. NTK071 TaxID=2802175 RepID=UPI001A8E9FAC|nr:hypothetical protein [Bacillus sp. NTK071]MBN8207937.1 hypothetical protein [Bacillus sp. NTK071]
MERFVKKSGLYQNPDKRRWEYWMVSQENKVLVSWICWSAPQDIVEKWKVSHAC